MDLITKFSSDGFRYYFMRECPFPGDGEFSWGRFAEIYNSELANNLGNLLSRCVTLITKNYNGVLPQTAEIVPQRYSIFVKAVGADRHLQYGDFETEGIPYARSFVENCLYDRFLTWVWRSVLDPANSAAEAHAPWKLVKTDKAAAKQVLHGMVESLRVASILLKPFIPTAAEKIYKSFNFPDPWDKVRYEDAAALKAQPDDLRVTAELVDGKVKPLFPRIE
jgi:methionyl-tRNA synthetase